MNAEQKHIESIKFINNLCKYRNLHFYYLYIKMYLFIFICSLPFSHKFISKQFRIVFIFKYDMELLIGILPSLIIKKDYWNTKEVNEIVKMSKEIVKDYTEARTIKDYEILQLKLDEIHNKIRVFF